MKFTQMPYQRVDFDAVTRQCATLTAQLKEAPDYTAARRAFLEWQDLQKHISTAISLAQIRHTIDTADSFYDDENNYYDEIMPNLQELEQALVEAMLNSAYRSDFEGEFGPLYFKNAEIQLRTFSPAIIADLQEENRLASEYTKLIASAQIDFEGKILTLSELTPYTLSPCRSTRTGAWNANGRFFSDHRQELDTLFDDLVKIRTSIAKKLGHETFTPLGYDRMLRNSYTAQDVARFREGVQRHIVPLVTRLKREQAERLGVEYPLSHPDNGVEFLSGNAKPQGGPDDIIAHGEKMYREMSPETAEFISFLLENELFDVLSRKGKAGGGYCTTLPDYRSPFIFANFNGTAHDVEVMTHEAGHAFAAYQARDILPAESQSPTMESCEIHSMSMEFFAWPWCQGFFGKDTQKFFYQHLAGALIFIPYGTMVDHFQHEVYANPGMAPAQRHQLWAELEGIYRPWLQDDQTEFYREGRFWQKQMHIYEAPFYYIDYCLAQTVALQFWVAMQADRADAWRRYMALVSKAGTLPFDGLVQTAGMQSPFTPGALEQIASTAAKWLDGFDKSHLV